MAAVASSLSMPYGNLCGLVQYESDTLKLQPPCSACNLEVVTRLVQGGGCTCMILAQLIEFISRFVQSRRGLLGLRINTTSH